MGSPAVVYTSTDEFKSISITGLMPLSGDMGVMSDLFNNLCTFNNHTPLSAVSFTSLTTVDGRAVTISLTIGGPLPAPFTLNVTTSDSWSQQELIMIAGLIRCFNNLQVLYGATDMTVTF